MWINSNTISNERSLFDKLFFFLVFVASSRSDALSEIVLEKINKISQAKVPVFSFQHTHTFLSPIYMKGC